MGIQAPAEVKFALIHEAALREGNLLKIGKLCEIAGVSRSGYYNWCDASLPESAAPMQTKWISIWSWRLTASGATTKVPEESICGSSTWESS